MVGAIVEEGERGRRDGRRPRLGPEADRTVPRPPAFDLDLGRERAGQRPGYDGGEPHLFLFTWDGFPTRDRGPMQAVESWTLAIDTSEAKVSRTSLFFGQAQEVLVAHFEGPAPAKRRYMIYTKRPDRGAFEALLRGIRFAPTT